MKIWMREKKRPSDKCTFVVEWKIGCVAMGREKNTKGFMKAAQLDIFNLRIDWHYIDIKEREGGSLPLTKPMIQLLKTSSIKKADGKSCGGSNLTINLPESIPGYVCGGRDGTLEWVLSDWHAHPRIMQDQGLQTVRGKKWDFLQQVNQDSRLTSKWSTRTKRWGYGVGKIFRPLS